MVLQGQPPPNFPPSPAAHKRQLSVSYQAPTPTAKRSRAASPLPGITPLYASSSPLVPAPGSSLLAPPTAPHVPVMAHHPHGPVPRHPHTLHFPATLPGARYNWEALRRGVALALAPDPAANGLPDVRPLEELFGPGYQLYLKLCGGGQPGAKVLPYVLTITDFAIIVIELMFECSGLDTLALPKEAFDNAFAKQIDVPGALPPPNGVGSSSVAAAPPAGHLTVNHAGSSQQGAVSGGYHSNGLNSALYNHNGALYGVPPLPNNGQYNPFLLSPSDYLQPPVNWAAQPVSYSLPTTESAELLEGPSPSTSGDAAPELVASDELVVAEASAIDEFAIDEFAFDEFIFFEATANDEFIVGDIPAVVGLVGGPDEPFLNEKMGDLGIQAAGSEGMGMEVSREGVGSEECMGGEDGLPDETGATVGPYQVNEQGPLNIGDQVDEMLGELAASQEHSLAGHTMDGLGITQDGIGDADHDHETAGPTAGDYATEHSVEVDPERSAEEGGAGIGVAADTSQSAAQLCAAPEPTGMDLDEQDDGIEVLPQTDSHQAATQASTEDAVKVNAEAGGSRPPRCHAPHPIDTAAANFSLMAFGQIDDDGLILDTPDDASSLVSASSTRSIARDRPRRNIAVSSPLSSAPSTPRPPPSKPSRRKRDHTADVDTAGPRQLRSRPPKASSSATSVPAQSPRPTRSRRKADDSAAVDVANPAVSERKLRSSDPNTAPPPNYHGRQQ
ncbi:hypothetical protein Q8F55_003379 [Vanrija albida]|uniref:Uncharacterized protein n=1 Tax=Vanrija albida TaxID=181172 RepID=A0ABR3Q4L7_9TREE